MPSSERVPSIFCHDFLRNLPEIDHNWPFCRKRIRDFVPLPHRESNSRALWLPWMRKGIKLLIGIHTIRVSTIIQSCCLMFCNVRGISLFSSLQALTSAKWPICFFANPSTKFLMRSHCSPILKEERKPVIRIRPPEKSRHKSYFIKKKFHFFFQLNTCLKGIRVQRWAAFFLSRRTLLSFDWGHRFFLLSRYRTLHQLKWE